MLHLRSPRYRVAAPPERPLLLFDGGCSFCRYWVGRWRSHTLGFVDCASSRESASLFPEIPAEDFDRWVVLVTPSGEAFGGAEAIARAFAAVPSRRPALWIYDRVPGARPAAELAYLLVARNRPFFSKLTRLLFRDAHEDPLDPGSGNPG